MSAELRLDLPWIPEAPERIGALAIRRGLQNVLSYDDGITLEVRLLQPSAYRTAEDLLHEAQHQEGPGRITLAAGPVPVEWRAEFRLRGLSFIDVSGVVDINWPRLRVSASRFGQIVERHRDPLPLQKNYARVVQELLTAAFEGSRPTVTNLAEGAGVTLSTASRTVSQLAEHGLVAKERSGSYVSIVVVDPVTIANRLADQTSWPSDRTIGGYHWGRNIWDVAARISDMASRAELDLAVTGRTGAAFLGILGTSSPTTIHCWVNSAGGDLRMAAREVGIEPAPESDSNVTISADPWKVGVHRRQWASFDDWTASVASPVRVWCDLHGERRGSEFAAQLWGRIQHGR